MDIGACRVKIYFGVQWDDGILYYVQSAEDESQHNGSGLFNATISVLVSRDKNKNCGTSLGTGTSFPELQQGSHSSSTFRINTYVHLARCSRRSITLASVS